MKLAPVAGGVGPVRVPLGVALRLSGREVGRLFTSERWIRDELEAVGRFAAGPPGRELGRRAGDALFDTLRRVGAAHRGLVVAMRWTLFGPRIDVSAARDGGVDAEMTVK